MTAPGQSGGFSHARPYHEPRQSGGFDTHARGGSLAGRGHYPVDDTVLADTGVLALESWVQWQATVQ